MAKRANAARMVSAAVLAKKIDLSRQRVSEFVREGLFPADADGRLNEDVCVVLYIRWLRGEGRKSTKTEAASRHQDAKAREVELRLAKELRELIPKDEVCDFLTETLGAFRSELSGVAAASSRDPEIRAVIESNLEAAIGRLRTKFTDGEASIRAGKPLSEDGNDGDG